MRMNEMITKDEMVKCLNKFSQAVPGEIYRNTVEKMNPSIRALPSLCTAFSQSLSVNSFRWRIQGERAGNRGKHKLTFSHGPRDPKRFGREKKWGLGTRQPRAKDCTKKGNPVRRHWQDFSVVESCMQIFYWILKNNNNNNNNNNNKNNNTNKW